MQTSIFLQDTDFCIAGLKRLCEGLMHRHGVVAFDKMNVVAITLDESMNVVILCAPEHGGAGNLVAIQVENGQHSPVAHRIQKRDGFPGAFKGGGLGLAIAHNSYHDQVWMVEDCAKCV